MQLTDAEIREILIRRKIEKKRRMRRRRRMTLIAVILIIVIAVILIKVLGHSGAGGGKTAAKDNKKAAADAAGDRGIIFIDPGHGGMDSGSDDDNGRYEKDDTLKLSLSIKKYLDEAGFNVQMSRTEDVQIDRTERGEMANKAGAQLFISVHRNKADGGGEGVEGFIPKTDDKASRLLGENLLHALAGTGFAERTIRAGTLYSSAEDYEENAATTMPSVLIEVGFLSSPSDNALFDSNLERNAKAMAGAIELTFMELHEPEKAEEYKKQLAETEKAAKKVVKSTKKAIKGTVKAADQSDGSDDSSSEGEDAEAETGIDPQA